MADSIFVRFFHRLSHAFDAQGGPAAAPSADTVAAEWPAQPPRVLRLEAAAPEEVAAGAPFDVIAALLPPGEAPTLPEALAAARPDPPPANGGALDLRLRVDAPGLVCHGPAARTARYADGQPALAVFSLSAERPGEAAIRLIAQQGLAEVGRVRLRLRVVAAAPATTAKRGGRAALAAQPPQAAEHLLAHAIAASYTADEFRALVESLDIEAKALPGRTPFTQALDLVRHVARDGGGPALAERVAVERPNWRTAIRGNKRAEKLV